MEGLRFFQQRLGATWMEYDDLSKLVKIELTLVPSISELPTAAHVILNDIAMQLTALSYNIGQQTPKPKETRSSNDPFARELRQTIRDRRTRDRIFKSLVFADPMWDILLDLTLARLESRKISISSAAIAASVPTATALRCLKDLVHSGMVERVADIYDKRRTFVQISDKAFDQMCDFRRLSSLHK